MSRIFICFVLFTIFGQERVRISWASRTVFTLTIFRIKCKKNYSDMTNSGWVQSTLKVVESLSTELWKNPIGTSPVKFQTLGVWFIVTRAYMLVKFGMDTEQIVTNATNIFWMHSFISGHKKVEYIFRNHVSIAHVTVFITRQYPESQSYCSSLMIDSWSTASDARQSRQGETVSFYR